MLGVIGQGLPLVLLFAALSLFFLLADMLLQPRADRVLLQLLFLAVLIFSNKDLGISALNFFADLLLRLDLLRLVVKSRFEDLVLMLVHEAPPAGPVLAVLKLIHRRHFVLEELLATLTLLVS